MDHCASIVGLRGYGQEYIDLKNGGWVARAFSITKWPGGPRAFFDK